MNRKNFLVIYTICVVMFYGAAYFVINLMGIPYITENTLHTVLPANTYTPLLDSTAPPELPQTSAASAVLIDAQSGAVLYEKNPDSRLGMASTTKIMTAKIILDTLPLDKIVTVPKEATTIEGSSIYLKENEKITVETLIYGLLLESGNDAATALAIACSDSVEDFARLMNETGASIGLKNTSFANPHGLTAENHFTTAYELAYITSVALKNEKFKEIVSTQKYVAPSLDGTFTRYFFNHNKLLRIYPGAIGVKTGYTEAAGRCLVSAAEKDTETYICVTLNDRNDWSDHTHLLDFAFENYDCVEIAAADSFAVNLNGKRLVNKEPVYLTVPTGENPVLSYKLSASSDTASVDYYVGNTKLGTFYLTAS